MENIDVFQLGVVGFIFYYFIKEFFIFLKEKGNGNGKKNGHDNIETQLAVINNKLDNHITHLSEDLRDVKDNIKEIWSHINKRK